MWINCLDLIWVFFLNIESLPFLQVLFHGIETIVRDQSEETCFRIGICVGAQPPFLATIQCCYTFTALGISYCVLPKARQSKINISTSATYQTTIIDNSILYIKWHFCTYKTITAHLIYETSGVHSCNIIPPQVLTTFIWFLLPTMMINNRKTAEIHNKKLNFGIKDLPKSLICKILVNLDNKTLFKISKLRERGSGYNLRKECDLVFIYKRFLFLEQKRKNNNKSGGLMMFKIPLCGLDKRDGAAVSLADCDGEEEGSTLRDEFDEEIESKVEKCVNKFEGKISEHANSTNNQLFSTVNIQEEEMMNSETSSAVLQASPYFSKGMNAKKPSELIEEIENSSDNHSPCEKKDNSFMSEKSYTSSTPTKQKTISAVTQDMIEQFDAAMKDFEDEELPQDLIKPFPLKRKSSQNNIINSSISDKIKFFEAQIRIHNDLNENRSKV